MGSSSGWVPNVDGKKVNINRFLILARIGALAVCGVTAAFGIERSPGPISDVSALGILVLYNVLAGLFGLSRRAQGRGGLVTLLSADSLTLSIIVGMTGAYNSPYFAMVLFVMAEIALHVGWRTGAALIVTVNAVQVVATGAHLAATGTPIPFSPVESRLLLLLLVGLLFVILAESVRRERNARAVADRATAQAADLNAIYAQMGRAHLDITKVFDTVFAAAKSVNAVLFSAILQKSTADPRWKVVASSDDQACPVGTFLRDEDPATSGTERDPALRVLTGPKLLAAAHGAFNASCREIILSDMPSYSRSEEGMLLVARGDGRALDAEDKAFLQALSFQAQLAIHNALLFRQQEQQFEQLKNFKKMQETFFAAAAHELKTPLTVLGVLVSTLRMAVADPSNEQSEMFSTIEQNVRRLTVHTTNMLAAARLETEDVVLNRSLIDPKRIARRSISALEWMFRDRDVAVDLLPDSKWKSIVVDPNRLEEIFSNLLSNALKFAEPSSCVTLSYRSEPGEDVFTVCNRGQKIPESESEDIFDKAFTGKAAGARAGSGLGLYIVRELVRLHGGRVWLDRQSADTCFCFSLPPADTEEIALYE